VRELDELEGIVVPREPSPEQEQQEDERASKRQRIEPSAAAADSNAPTSQAALPAPPPPQPTVASGILSAHAVDSLKYMASLREKRAAQPVAVKAAPAPVKSTGLGALADYGSDSD
jgi:hypothetical protein